MDTAEVGARAPLSASLSVSPALTPSAVEAADPRELMLAFAELSCADITGMTAQEAEALVIGSDRVIAAVRGRQALAMDTLASRVDEDLQRREHERRREAEERNETDERPGGTPLPPGPDLHGMVASMLAPALHCSTGTVRRRLEADRRLVCTAEATHQALWDGDLDLPRADAVTEAAQSVDADLWARFEALVLETAVDPVTGEVTLVSEAVKGMSRGQLSRRAARIARTLDPASSSRAAGMAQDQRSVVVRPNRHHPGLATWTAQLPTDVSQQMAAAVDALAGQYAKAHPGTGLDRHRADALADLVLGNTEVTTVVELLVPVLPAQTCGSTPADSVESPSDDGHGVSWVIPGVVDDPRHGVLLPEAVAELLSDPDTVVRLARLDPDGSIVQDPTAYRPSASTRRRVRTRDGSCRFPGCATPAVRCDLDHVTAHPTGPTVHTNLICLCRTHHRFKHHSGWTPSLAPDGTVTWTAPDGRTWTTQPAPHQIRDELSLYDRIDAEVAHDLRRGWFPGLPPGMSLTDLVHAETQVPDDPPENPHTPDPPPDWQQLDDHTVTPTPLSSVPPSPLERHLDHLIALAA